MPVQFFSSQDTYWRLQPATHRCPIDISHKDHFVLKWQLLNSRVNSPKLVQQKTPKQMTLQKVTTTADTIWILPTFSLDSTFCATASPPRSRTSPPIARPGVLCWVTHGNRPGSLSSDPGKLSNSTQQVQSMTSSSFFGIHFTSNFNGGPKTGFMSHVVWCKLSLNQISRLSD